MLKYTFFLLYLLSFALPLQAQELSEQDLPSLPDLGDVPTLNTWQQKLLEAKRSDSKLTPEKILPEKILIEMLSYACEDERGHTQFYIRDKGPELFYPEGGQNQKRDFENFLLLILTARDLDAWKDILKLLGRPSNEDHIAQIFSIIFYLYPTEKRFIFQLQKKLENALLWTWSNPENKARIASLIQTIQLNLEEEKGNQLRVRFRHMQRIEDTPFVAFVFYWQLLKTETAYDFEADQLKKSESEVATTSLMTLLISQDQLQTHMEGLGTKTPLTLFQNDETAKSFLNGLPHQEECVASDIFETPDSFFIPTSNWGLLPEIKPEIKRQGIGIITDPTFVDMAQEGRGNEDKGEGYNLCAFLADDVDHPFQTFSNICEADFQNKSVLIVPELEMWAGERDPASHIFCMNEFGKKLKTFVSTGGRVIFAFPGRPTTDFINELFGFHIDIEDIVKQGTYSRQVLYPVFPETAHLPESLEAENHTALFLQSSLPESSLEIYYKVVIWVPFEKGTIYLLGWDWYDAKPVGQKDGGWLTLLKGILDYESSAQK